MGRARGGGAFWFVVDHASCWSEGGALCPTQTTMKESIYTPPPGLQTVCAQSLACPQILQSPLQILNFSAASLCSGRVRHAIELHWPVSTARMSKNAGKRFLQ